MTQVSFSELNELIGSVGIGSVAMLGFAMILDAVAPVSEIVERSAGTQTWTFFVVVPLIVFSYVAGVLCVAVGRATRQGLTRNLSTPIGLQDVEEKLITIVTLEYRNYLRKLDILDGTLAAFVVLAIGVAFESYSEGLFLFGLIACSTAVVSSVLSMRIAARTERDFRTFLQAFISGK